MWSLLCLCICYATGANAQSVITGTVKDTSGAVLPGVTVELSSPAPIEQNRTTSTEGNVVLNTEYDVSFVRVSPIRTRVRSQPPQLVVDERHQRRQCLLVALTSAVHERSDP
jgi:hypothetical protein